MLPTSPEPTVLRILLAEPLEPAADARLAAGASVIRPPASDERSLIQHIAECDAMIVRTHNHVSRRVLEAGKRLRVVGVAGVGTDRVDVEAASELGIAVLNTAHASSDAVAEFTIALMLELLRPVGRLYAAYKSGCYAASRAQPHGVELRGLCVGIVGMGRIGSRVARLCSAGFECRVLYNDIVEVGPFPFAAAAVEKIELWRTCDVISLHVPLTAQTRGLIDAAALAHFKPGALLINTARGPVVRLDALRDALRAGRLGGAALDVTDPEPLAQGDPLFSMDRCILTPHVAARTQAGLQGMFGIVDDVLEWLRARAAGK
ncbi:D-3-phosphoglycerate dehydrogenase [Phycisphaerae bacterium RAS1]|nr:D-3-phosphoglycerate dehydrogenase [Phycisphaerae bacterium RAS1]